MDDQQFAAAMPVVGYSGPSAPVDGTTGANEMGKGAQYTDKSTGELYLNVGSIASPVWKMVLHE